MRTMVFCLITLLVLPASAATSLPVSNWQRVQALPAGTTVDVKARKGHTKCVVQAVDAESLTCSGTKGEILQRVDVRSIVIHHRGRSTLAGAAIGAGAGAIIGAAAAGPGCSPHEAFCIDIVSRGAFAGIVGVALGVVGTPVGYFTDFTHSTVYKAK